MFSSIPMIELWDLHICSFVQYEHFVNPTVQHIEVLSTVTTLNIYLLKVSFTVTTASLHEQLLHLLTPLPFSYCFVQFAPLGFIFSDPMQLLQVTATPGRHWTTEVNWPLHPLVSAGWLYPQLRYSQCKISASLSSLLGHFLCLHHHPLLPSTKHHNPMYMSGLAASWALNQFVAHLCQIFNSGVWSGGFLSVFMLRWIEVCPRGFVWRGYVRLPVKAVPAEIGFCCPIGENQQIYFRSKSLQTDTCPFVHKAFFMPAQV